MAFWDLMTANPRVLLFCASLLWALMGLEAAFADNISVVCVGDSIVAPYSMDEYHQGWGVALQQKLTNATVYDMAVGGTSSKSFIASGYWAIALAKVDSTQAKYVFLEFGHNDNPGKGDRTTDPGVDGDFRVYIRQYIDESRAHGARPVLVTPTPRWYWSGGVINNSGNLPYAQAMLAVAAEKQCAVVDLNTLMLNLFNSLGQAGSDYLLGTQADLTKDSTHFSQTGALVEAKMIVDSLPAQEPNLVQFINSDGGPAAPGAATSPAPAAWSTGATLNASLSWTADTNAMGHAVYFGIANPPDFRLNFTARTPVTFAPGTLEYGTTYYWRIDTINQRGTATGTVWSFRTQDPVTTMSVEEVSLLPEDDSRLYAGGRDTNYATMASFWARNLGDTALMNTGIMQFRLPTDGRLFWKAKLELWNKGSQASKTLRVFGLKDGTAGEDIDQASITYKNAPGIATATATLNADTVELYSVIGGAAERACITPTGTAQDALSNFISLDTNKVITLYGASSSGAMEFYTKEGGTSDGQKPHLHLWLLNNGCAKVYLADFNSDCRVDMLDFAILASQWMGSAGTPPADIIPLGTGDGTVNGKDLTRLASDWLSGL
jgi:lysophospholipase L1-like esterase